MKYNAINISIDNFVILSVKPYNKTNICVLSCVAGGKFTFPS